MVSFVYCSVFCMAQIERDVRERGDFPVNEKENTLQDSTKRKLYVKPQRFTWKWKHNGVYKVFVPVDTLQNGIHNHNYIFKNSVSNTYLGNFPSPYESDIFINREEEEFYPLSRLKAFLLKPEDAKYYNTTTPFTRLTYFNGGGRGKSETLFEVLHTQNINPDWNAGIIFHTISSDGRYMHQKGNVYHFSAFSSYEKKRWAISLFINQNNGHIDENGGVLKRTDILDTNLNSHNIAVKISDGVSNHISNINRYAEIQYHIGRRIRHITDKDTTFTYPMKFIFAATQEKNSYKFKETIHIADFFKHTFLTKSANNDIIENDVLKIKSLLVIEGSNTYKRFPKLFSGLEYKKRKDEQRISIDTLPRKTTVYESAFFHGGLFNIDTGRLNYDISAYYGLSGDYAKNFELKARLVRYLESQKNLAAEINMTVSDKNANPFFETYVGNHNFWKNSMKNTKERNISLKFLHKKWKTETGCALNMRRNHIYFDSLAMPAQYDKDLKILTLWLKQTFKLSNFYFSQNFYFQKTKAKEVIALPAVSLYSHNYYENDLFRKALRLQAGIDIFYNSAFYADHYAPGIMQFHNQRRFKTGNYPKTDVFLTLKIKTAVLYAKYEHLNYHWGNKNYFSSPFYPINPAVFKFGVRWDLFY